MSLYKKAGQRDLDALMRAYQSSMKISVLALSVVAVIEIIMLSFTFMNAAFYGEYLWKYRIFYISLLVLAVSYIAISFYIKRNWPKRYVILNIFNPFSACFFFLWAIGITYNDAIVNVVVDPTAYMTFSLSVPLCFYLPPVVYGVIAVTADLIMSHVLVTMSGSAATLPNLIIFFVFQLVLGISLLRTKRGLTEQIVTAEEQKKEIEELSSAQSRFFSSMSHEIRTPINSLIGLDEMILRRNISEDVNEDAEHILSASKMLLHLVNDLLDISKMESGMLELTYEPYQTRNMFSEIWGILSVSAKQKGLDFFIDLSPTLPECLYGDEVRIKQILINLLNNAIKYTKTGAVGLKVYSNWQSDNDPLLIYEVSDTGIGIKKEYIPHLFTAYRRVEDEETKYIEGTGLGLSIVKQLLELMNGTIEVESVYGEGSTFRVTVPQKVACDNEIGEIHISEEKSHGGAYRSRLFAPRARILIVDDTPANLYVEKRLLDGSGIEIDTAESGAAALKLTMEKKYHVILMDHFMPEMDGIECYKAIQGQMNGANRDTKTLMLTANVSSESEAIYRKEGFDGYLSKPVSVKALEEELIRLLPRELLEDKKISKYNGKEDDEHSVEEEISDSLIKIYTSAIDETARQLDMFLANGDIKNYTIKVHGLKSTSRLVNELSIAKMAEMLEEAGNRGDMETIQKMHPELISAYMACKEKYA